LVLMAIAQEKKWLELDTQSLIALRGQLESRRADYNDRIWETAKFFTTIFSGLASVSVLVQYASDIGKLSFAVRLGLLFVPALALSVSIIGLANLRRECSRLMETVSMMMKLEKQLGFYSKDFVPPRWKDDYKTWGASEKNWLSEREKPMWRNFLKPKASVITVFFALFTVYIAISSLLLIWFGILLFI
jgi:hypothetical protein